MTSSQRIRRAFTALAMIAFALSAFASIVVPLTYHDI